MSFEAHRLSQMRSWFDELVDLAPDAREPRIEEIAKDDPALAQQLRILLAADANPVRTETAVSRLAAMTVLAPGTILGAYRIERLLGAGGMGHVYLAQRCDGRADHRVAIKTLRTSLDALGLSEHFRRERRLLAKLEHPNIARFIDAGEFSDGTPYVILEYIDGEPLLDHAERRRLGWRERVGLALQIARAVEHAHRQLILHRDVKPGNVIVDRDGVPKLLDFGIAASADSSEPTDGETAAEQRYFSLAYAAPEQVLGNDDGAAVDVYGLGALCYELLAGRQPLVLDGMPFDEAKRRVLDEMPPPLSASTATLPYAASALRGDIDRIVLHCLNKQATQRYATVGELADDLQRALRWEPISLRDGDRLYWAHRFYRRHRVATVLGSALLIGLIGSGLVYRHQRDVAIAERERATAVSELLVDAFRAADPNQTEGKDVSARQIMEQARRAIERQEGLDPEMAATLMNTLAEVHSSLGMHQSAFELADRSLDLSNSEGNRYAARFWRASADVSLGKLPAAKAAIEQSLTELKPPYYWYFRFRHLELSLERQLNQRSVLELAVALREETDRWLGEHDPLTIRAKVAEIEILSQREFGIEKATKEAALLLDSLEAKPPNSDTLRLWRLAGRLYRRAERYAEAIRAAESEMGMAERLYGANHHAYVLALSSKAMALMRVDIEAARAAYLEAVSRAESSVGRRSALHAGLAFNAAGSFLEEPVDVARALEYTQLSLDVGRDLFPENARQLGFFWAARTAALLYARQDDEALEAADRARAIFSQRAENSTTSLPDIELMTAVAEYRNGDIEAAKRRIDALGDWQKRLPADAASVRLAKAVGLPQFVVQEP